MCGECIRKALMILRGMPPSFSLQICFFLINLNLCHFGLAVGFNVHSAAASVTILRIKRKKTIEINDCYNSLSTGAASFLHNGEISRCFCVQL